MIENIRRDNHIFRILSESEETTNEIRKKELLSILKKYQLHTDNISKAREGINNMRENALCGQLRRPWIRLSEEHKMKQLLIYLTDKIPDEIMRKQELEKYVLLINTKKLKSKNVEYDVDNGKIINIIM